MHCYQFFAVFSKLIFRIVVWDVPDFGSSTSGVWRFLANSGLAKFLARSDRFSRTAVHADYLQLKVMKLVLACHVLVI